MNLRLNNCYFSGNVNLTAFALNEVLGSMDRARFYRYPGSLTTPPCHESVKWTGFAQAQEVSTQQVSHQRSVI